MFTALSRIIKFGVLGFWRNGWLSATTISIMVLTLIVFSNLLVFKTITATALETLQDKIDISIYFKTDTPEDNILQTKSALESLSEVKKVDYVSRDKALELFKEKYADNPVVVQSLEELQENPLLASINIKANNPNQYSIIADYLEKSSIKDWFEKVTYAQNAVVIERLNKIINSAEKGGLILIIFLSLIVVLVMFNTIRLAIYSNREEIGIMRLVGAPNAFIRGPYMFEGILYGLSAAIISTIIITPLIYIFSPYVDRFIPEMKLWSYFLSHFFSLFGWQLLFGIGLGVVSSWIAIMKYLKI